MFVSRHKNADGERNRPRTPALLLLAIVAGAAAGCQAAGGSPQAQLQAPPALNSPAAIQPDPSSPSLQSLQTTIGAGAVIAFTKGTTKESGGGVYIGNRVVLTAAHVVQDVPIGTAVTVALGGNIGRGVVARRVDGFGPGKDDVAAVLLSDNWILKLPELDHVPVCDDPPLAGGTPVWVVQRDYIAFRAMRGADAMIGTYEPGRSGSAIVDPTRPCVAGILSFGELYDLFNPLYISQRTDLASSGTTLVTPASQIRAWLTSWGIAQQPATPKPASP